jgi:DNA mismatch endonuclease (patch repair protein)
MKARMVDMFTPEQRSRNMAAIRSKDTCPEMAVRKLVHRLGFRYRLHRRDLPGTPDLVFRSRKKIIFVHGCFWHLHSCRRGQFTPATNAEFWRAKRERNVRRDRSNHKLLSKDGWTILTIWECQTRDERKMRERIEGFLSSSLRT